MRISIIALALLSPIAAHAQTPSLTANLAGVQQVQQTFGKGVQIYGCQQGSGTPKWIFLAPDATLYQLLQSTPEQVATHSAGPAWEWNDGSGLFGTTIQSVASPDPNSIPWLLLQTQPFGLKGGVLSAVNYVVRSDTSGGTAPTSGCDTVHLGTTARVPYTATYTFYTATTK